MNEVPEEFRERWEKEGEPAVTSMAAILDGIDDEAIAGGVLGHLVAIHLSALSSPRRQAEMLANFLKMVLQLVGVINEERAKERRDWEVKFGDSLGEQMAEDPKVKEAVTDMVARIRQGLSDFYAGKFSSIAEVMESIGMTHIDPEEAEEIFRNAAAPRKPS